MLLILIAIFSFSLDMISAEFALELGWLPQGVFCMYTSEDVYDSADTFYTSLAGKVFLLNCVFAGGGMESIFHKNDKFASFAPNGIDYMFIAGIRLGIMEIFYQHNCIHPAPTYTYLYKFAPQWEAWYDKIGIRIEGKIK